MPRIPVLPTHEPTFRCYLDGWRDLSFHVYEHESGERWLLLNELRQLRGVPPDATWVKRYPEAVFRLAGSGGLVVEVGTVLQWLSGVTALDLAQFSLWLQRTHGHDRGKLLARQPGAAPLVSATPINRPRVDDDWVQQQVAQGGWYAVRNWLRHHGQRWLQGRLGWFWIALAPWALLWALLKVLVWLAPSELLVTSWVYPAYYVLLVVCFGGMATLAVLWLRACYRAGVHALNEGASLLMTWAKWGTAVVIAMPQLLFHVWLLAFGVALTDAIYLDEGDLRIEQVRGPAPGLILRGPIQPGSARQLLSALESHPDRASGTPLLIRLHSPGGLVVEAQSMRGHLLRFGVNTEAIGSCSSACTALFMAGRERWLAHERVRLGFHRAGSVLTGDYGAPTEADHDQVQWWVDRGVSREFAQKVLEVSFDDLWTPSVAEMKAAGVVTGVR